MDNKTETYGLTYLPLLIRLQCCETIRLPSFLGSTLHGVLGWALSANPGVYRYMFENRRYEGGGYDIVNPYIIEQPRSQIVYQQGDLLSFQFILLGKATEYVEDIVKLLSQVKWFELGAERKRFTLIDIIQENRLEPIWRLGRTDWNAAVSEMISSRAFFYKSGNRCSVHLLTPLRIRRGGKLVQEVDFATIIRNITNRIQAITERYGGFIDKDVAASLCELSKSIETVSSNVYVTEIKRYSTRRKTKLDMSGLLGSVTFAGELSPFIPWLEAARILHIGRNVTFGCGQIQLLIDESSTKEIGANPKCT